MPIHLSIFNWITWRQIVSEYLWAVNYIHRTSSNNFYFYLYYLEIWRLKFKVERNFQFVNSNLLIFKNCFNDEKFCDEKGRYVITSKLPVTSLQFSRSSSMLTLITSNANRTRLLRSRYRYIVQMGWWSRRIASQPSMCNASGRFL